MAFDWSAFLTAWDNVGVSASSFADPVSNAEVEAFTDRFKIAPPADFLAFLRVSNGWRDAGGHPVEIIRGLGEVQHLAKASPDTLEAYGRFRRPRMSDGVYFSYGSAATTSYVPSQLRHGLLVSGGEASGEGDCEVMLNPQVIHADGAWEVWMIASWLPGVQRYRDFTELMLDLAHHRFDVAAFADAYRVERDGRPPTVFTGPPGGKRRKGKAADIPEAAELLRVAREGKHRERMRAVKAMAGSGDREVSAYLREVAGGDPDERFRVAAVQAMETRGDPESLELLANLMRDNLRLRGAAAAAIGNIRSGPARAVLYEAVEGVDEQLVCAAMGVLAQRRDLDICEVLVKHAFRPPSEMGFWGDHVWRTAWLYLDRFSEATEPLILRALDAPDPMVRLMAASHVEGRQEMLSRDTQIQHRVLRAFDSVAAERPDLMKSYAETRAARIERMRVASGD